MTNCVRSVLTIVALVTFVPAAHAAPITILSQTHFDGFANGVGGTFQQALSVFSWTQGNAFSDVSVSAFLVRTDKSYSGTAYLTKKLGPGTTPADEVAHAAFVTAGDFNFHDTTLFTGLFLGAGTYYLVLSAPTNTQMFMAWGGTAHGTATFNKAPGVSGGEGYLLATNQFSAYPPDQLFNPFTADDLKYNITGVLPEPASLVTLGLGLAGLVVRARRRMKR